MRYLLDGPGACPSECALYLTTQPMYDENTRQLSRFEGEVRGLAGPQGNGAVRWGGTARRGRPSP